MPRKKVQDAEESNEETKKTTTKKIKKDLDILKSCKHCKRLLLSAHATECEPCKKLQEGFDRFLKDYMQGKLPKPVANKLTKYLRSKTLEMNKGNDRFGLFGGDSVKFKDIYDEIVKFILAHDELCQTGQDENTNPSVKP